MFFVPTSSINDVEPLHNFECEGHAQYYPFDEQTSSFKVKGMTLSFNVTR